MKRNLPVLRPQNKISQLQSSHDVENQNKNSQNLKIKKAASSNTLKPKIQQEKKQKIEQKRQENEDLKWQYLNKFIMISSKSHFIHRLKHSTLFLAYSIADKTVQLIGQKIKFEYWAAVCLFLSMKFQQIYPPRLREISHLVKYCLVPKQYFQYQLEILTFLNLDLNFKNINTILSQYLHEVDQLQKYYIYYLMEISLFQRQKLKKFQLEEIIISIMFMLSSHRLQFANGQKINGYQFQRIQECTKIIIVNQMYAPERTPFVSKKYRTQKMKNVAYSAIPKIEGLTLLLSRKAGNQTKQPKIVGLIGSITESSDEGNVDFDTQSKFIHH